MRLRQTYKQLPATFYAPCPPTPVASPVRVGTHQTVAKQLGIDPAWLNGPEALQWLSGQLNPEASEPLALAYAGHQFGHWVPLLGDGRAVVLGQITDPHGLDWDLQLKGSGPTPFSRNGDGRASIGPVVREYLATEAMAALGIPTTRALALLTTGESVQRATSEPGGILVRVAQSHIRIGTFEYVARQGDRVGVSQLLAYLIHRHFPHWSDDPEPGLRFYRFVIEKTAHLIAQWMAVGFIHGVMNTDNASVLGETLDYGPFGFLDEFNPETVYSSIDQAGRYGYQQQPAVATWNLARLAESLLTALSKDRTEAQTIATEALGEFPEQFRTHFNSLMAKKIGLESTDENHQALALALLDVMAEQQADMTLTFRTLGALETIPTDGDEPFKALFDDPRSVEPWLGQWRACLAARNEPDVIRQERMKRINPAFVLRNHLAERAAVAATQNLDFEPMHRLTKILSDPYSDQLDEAEWAGPPTPDERVLTTFCGT